MLQIDLLRPQRLPVALRGGSNRHLMRHSKIPQLLEDGRLLVVLPLVLVSRAQEVAVVHDHQPNRGALSVSLRDAASSRCLS